MADARSLHDALSAFAVDASVALAHDTAAGAEIPFEVVEEPGARGAVPLYCYRQLTGAFIRERLGKLSALSSYAPAARALEHPAIAGYLRARGAPRVPSDARAAADAALGCFLEALFDGQSDFVLRDERVARALTEIDAVLRDGRTAYEVVVPVLGLALGGERIELADDLVLLPGDAVADAPPEAVWSWGAGAEPNVLARLQLERAPDDPAPLGDARVRLRRMLTALRLFAPGGFALAPTAWARADDGPWQAVALGASGRGGGRLTLLSPGDAEELRGFSAMVARRVPRRGEVAWALARYEMGCERGAPFESLSDHLLALRALLEPEGPQSGRLSGRLAAICALPEGRARLAERVAHAVSLERAVVAGLAAAEPGADALVAEVEGHLRALLRDVVCGHLDSDLVAVADGILEDAAAGADGVPA